MNLSGLDTYGLRNGTGQRAIVVIELVPSEAPASEAEEVSTDEPVLDAERSDPVDITTTPPTSSRSRARSAADWGLLSFSVGAMGAALILDLLAFRHAQNLAHYDPGAGGFLDASLQYRRVRGAGLGMGIGGSAALLVTVSSRAWFASERFRWGALSVGVPAAVLGLVLAMRTPPRIGDTLLTQPHRAMGALIVGVGVSLALVPLSVHLRRRAPRAPQRALMVVPTGTGLDLVGRF